MPNNYDLRYHGHAAIFCSLSDESVIRTGGPGNTTDNPVQDGFSTVVHDYRHVMEKEFRRVQKANRTRRQPRFASHLYNPCRQLAFGYADYLNFVLIDDFDAFYRLTNALHLPINQVTLVFCPVLDSLQFPAFGSRLPASGTKGWLLRSAAKSAGVSLKAAAAFQLTSPFVELQRLLKVRLPRGQNIHAFQRETPLSLFSRIKLGGLAAVGGGLRQRRAVFQLIGAKVVQTQLALLQERRDGNPEAKQILETLEFDEDTIRSVRVAILDAQGPEELAVYVAAKNYSLAVTLLAAITSATHGDLLSANPEATQLLREHTESVIAHGALKRLARLCNEEDRRSDQTDTRESQTLLEDNHVFSSTYSVAAVAETDLNAIEKNVRGSVEVYARGNVMAGHLQKTEETLRSCLPPVTRVVRLSSADIHRHLVGRYDLDFSLTWLHDQPVELQPVSSFLVRVKAIRNALMQSGRPGETGLLEFASGVVVPLPKLSKAPLVPNVPRNYVPIIPGLQRLADELFGVDGELDAKALRRVLVPLRLPVRLERSILHLFKTYRDSLLDPMLFDAVLDLHPQMAALHKLLTNDLKRFAESIDQLAFNSQDELSLHRDVLFREATMTRLREIVEAAQNALSHRVWHDSRSEQHDWAIGFRGGLTQIIHGVSSVINCGVELLRACKRSRFAADVERSEWEQPTGLFTRLTLYRLPESRRMHIGPMQRTMVGMFNVSVGHLFSPTELVEHFNAVFQLIHNAWEDVEPAIHEPNKLWQSETRGRDLPPLEPKDSQLRTDIFTGLATQVFVFGSDFELGRRWRVINWNQQLLAGAADLVEMRDRFLDMAFRAFMSIAPLQEPTLVNADPGDLPLDHPWCKDFRKFNRKPRLEKPIRFDEFLSFVKSIGPYCCYYDQVSERIDPDSTRIQSFYWAEYCRAMPLLEDAWWRLVTLARFCATTNTWKPTHLDAREIREVFEGGLHQGQASLDYLLQELGIPHRESMSHWSFELSSVAYLVAAFVSLEFEQLDPDRYWLHMKKDPAGESIYESIEPGGKGVSKKWGTFLLDRRYPRAFCVEPEQRTTRFAREVALHRILWDIAARRRSRIVAQLTSPVSGDTCDRGLGFVQDDDNGSLDAFLAEGKGS